MVGIDDELKVIRETIAPIHVAGDIVDAWEAKAIADTDIDGPLSWQAKLSLITIISEALENYKPMVQPEIKRGPGRPPKVSGSHGDGRRI